jgi:predicted AAA+ superfamily ATPase
MKKKLFKRENYLSMIRPFYYENDLIKVITGVRRSGKSSIMQLISEEIIESGVNPNNIIYINLDKKGYTKIKTSDVLEELIDNLSKGIKGTKYLFIDEIQNVKNFERMINAFREEDDYSIFITGSNSYLLSGEMMTHLTGRYLEFEVYPLSYYEYIAMKEFYKIPLEQYPQDDLNKYILEGGFPRTIFINDPVEKRAYIKGIIDEIYKKDIKRRVKIRNKAAFDLVQSYIINNYGATTSINNIVAELNAGGLKIQKKTVLKYIQYLVDAKILYVCDRFDMKSKRMLSSDKKYYLADLSFASVTNPDSRINYGPALENIVYTYAKSKRYEVSVGRIGKLECDFILKDMFLNYSYVQVAYTILNSVDTENREYAPLEKIKDNFPKYVLTTDFLIQKRNGIIHANLMQFMKENKNFN